MKREVLIQLLIVVLLGVASFCGAISASTENFKAPTRQSVEYTDTTTIHTYEIKDIKYPVFKSKNGAFYIWKTSKKTNKKYKYYLPKEIQEKIGRKYDSK